MITFRNLAMLGLSLAAAPLTSAAVPGSINYQGRLTNVAGVPQPGVHAMSLKIYDAATGGTQLYTESLGNVTADANGVYSFQFGASGTSDTLVTETIATTNGTSLSYQKTLSNTPIVANSISVTDGTYNWNQVTGNPGSTATATATVISGFVVGATVTGGGSGYTSAPTVTITGNGSGAAATATISSGSVSGINITSAGSGYTGGATITIAPPPAPFLVNYSGGAITATYASPPAAGQTITATYRYSASGISGALAGSSEQWLELTVDGAAQSPRQKVLAVPFALNSFRSEVATSLAERSKTCPLVVFASPSGATKKLPVTVSPTGSLIGMSDSFYKVVESSVNIIDRLEANVVITSGNATQYPAVASIDIAAYSKTGTRTVVASGTRNDSGSLVLQGPFILDHTNFEYCLECSISTGGTNNVTKSTTLHPLEIMTR